LPWHDRQSATRLFEDSRLVIHQRGGTRRAVEPRFYDETTNTIVVLDRHDREVKIPVDQIEDVVVRRPRKSALRVLVIGATVGGALGAWLTAMPAYGFIGPAIGAMLGSTLGAVLVRALRRSWLVSEPVSLLEKGRLTSA